MSSTDNKLKAHNTEITKHHICFMAFVSVITITLLSKSSFLYPLNDWVDSNCFFTVGKAMLEGKVLYRDIFEQKGPLIYFLHALAARISYRSFLGMYFFEIFTCFIFLYYSTKLFSLFSESDCIIIFIPIVSALTYSSAAFCHGDSVEEFFLPLITYSLYTGCTICLEETIDYRKVFFTGICTGVVLWTKYTAMGFYFGWILVLSICFLKQGKQKEVVKAALYYAAGVLVATIPAFFYFLKNNALADLFKVYFYNNIVLYSDRPEHDAMGKGWGWNVLQGVGKAFQNNVLLGAIIVVFVILFHSNFNRKVYVLLIATLFLSCLFIFRGSKSYNYYSLIFYSYLGAGLGFPISWLHQMINNKIKRFPRGEIAAVFLLCLMISIFISPNRYMLLEKKENLPQYKFAQIISEDRGASLLNYGFLDGGFYTVTGIVPNCKYFCKMNIPLEEMIKAQEEYLINGSADYVVTRDQEIDYTKYDLVSKASYIFEGKEWLYRLYKLDECELP